MDLLSAFKRKTPPAAPAAADEVQRARTRARQRLIGAAVLVVAGIIVFPLLFETQPRPVPVDLPIEIPRKDGAPPLAMPAPAAQAPASAPPAAVPRVAPAPERVITESKEEAGRELAVATGAAASAAAPAAPAAVSAGKAASAARSTASAAGTQATDAARAQALLEGRSPPAAAAASDAAAGTPRFVVQVGAFADPAVARETRAKVEKLGLKTYTHVAETPSGPRTRVRVGPFATREEAERAAAKLKAAALPAAILTL
jgi:DedD protein